MSDEFDRDSTGELQALAVQLGDHDWRVVLEAEKSLGRAGQAGIDAVLWGLSHPNARAAGLRRLHGPPCHRCLFPPDPVDSAA